MDKPKTPKCDQRAVNKYIKNNYDRLNLTVYKGQREILQAWAKSNDYSSVNTYVQHLIRADMEQHGGDVAAWDALAPQGTAGQESTEET